MSASEQIARQYANGASNKKTWGNILINVKVYEAEGDGVTDDTAAIQAAINAASLAGGGTVYAPIAAYRIKGVLNIPRYVKLVGDRIGLSQGPGTNQDETNRILKIVETTFLIDPTDINATPITMDRQSAIKGIAFIYPNQTTTATLESEVIQYAPTIVASHGCQLENCRVYGAYDFFKATGEAIHVANLYGYTFGRAIDIRSSSDVCRLENIHLNPNVLRPPVSLIELAKSRVNSIAFYFENCDGIQMQNIHLYGYRTGVQSKGGNAADQTVFGICNFFFDAVGVAFDVDTDSAWPIQILNGIAVTGYSDSTDYAGFLRLNKTVSQSFISPIQVANVSVFKGSGYVTPDYYVNFKYLYNFDVSFSGTSYDGGARFISSHNAYARGIVRNGNTQLDIEKLYTRKNWITNADMVTDAGADGIPDGWIKDLGASTDLTISRDTTGFMKLTTTTGMSQDYKGLYQRVTLPANTPFRIMVKARGTVPSTAKVWVKGYTSGFANLLEKNASFNADGFATVTFTEQKSIVDVLICPTRTAGESIVIEYVQLITDTRGYIA